RRDREHDAAGRGAGAEEASVLPVSSAAPTREDDKLLGRAAEIGRVMAKYGLRERGAGDVPLRERARNLRNALEELGPPLPKRARSSPPGRTCSRRSSSTSWRRCRTKSRR